MSSTITISGNKSILESQFQPPIIVNDKYECGLLYFSVLNAVPNINVKNNLFSYGDEGKQLKIPYGAYDLYDICEYLENEIDDCEIKIKPNNNTLTCSLFCSKVVNFEPRNSVGRILGFPNVKLEPNKWHVSKDPVNIIPLSVIKIECDLVQGSYNNGSPSHVLYEFVPNVPPGHRYIELPQNIVYLPINRNIISTLTVKIVDQHNNCIDFRGEDIQLRLHLRRAR